MFVEVASYIYIGLAVLVAFFGGWFFGQLEKSNRKT
jgi:hypothetical protein